MNQAIITELIKQATQLESTLFSLHRDSGDRIEINRLGEAWVSSKEILNALVKIEADRNARLTKAREAMASPEYSEAMRAKDES